MLNKDIPPNQTFRLENYAIAKDAPAGILVDQISLSFKVDSTGSLCGVECENPTIDEFLDLNNKNFWRSGNMGGAGPGYTYETAKTTTIDGVSGVEQTSHPTTSYEWLSPDNISTSYYIPLNGFPEKVLIARFDYNANNSQKDKILEEVKKVITSLKFTN